MALENSDLQQAFDELRNSIQGGSVSIKDLKKEADSLTKTLTGATAEFAKGMGKFGKDLSAGDAGLKTLSGAIDATANAAGGLAKAIPYAGEAINAAFRAVADASKFLLDQLDQTAKSFNEISTVGAAGAQGMTDIRNQFARAGLSLQGFQKQIVANAETLAQFRGLTSKGADDFSKIVGGLTQGTDLSMRKLGMNSEQIAGTAAAFIKQQTSLGRAQTMSNDQLIRGTIQYAKELDLISKITGQNREAIQQQQEAALSESRFRAVYEEMLSRGQEKSAKALMGFQTVISGLDKEAGQGLRDMSAGIIDTAAAQKLYNSTNGKAADIVERLKNGAITQNQAQVELGAALKNNSSVMRDQAKYNKDAGETYLGFAGALKIQRAQYDQNGEVVKEATDLQNKQLSETDQLTLSTIHAQQQLERLAMETSLMATKVLPYMAVAVDKATAAMIKMFKWAESALSGDGKKDDLWTAIKNALKAGFKSWAMWVLSPGKSFVDWLKGDSGESSDNATPSSSGGGGFLSNLFGGGQTFAAPQFSGDTQKILATIRGRESGGNYQIKNPNASASGAYQFIDSTWQSLTKKYGIGQEFKSAKDAPPPVQDAVAGKYVEDILKQAGGDVSKVPLAWYTGNIQGNLSQDLIAKNNGVTPAMYQAKWLNDYNKNAGLSGPNTTYTSGTTPISSTSGATTSTPAPGQDAMSILMAQLGKLDDMLSVLKNQLTTSEKILKLTH